MTDTEYDVVVVGAGNAALCSALAAEEAGAKVLVVERAPEEEAGGNSRYTAGAIRFAHEGVEDLKTVVDLTEEEIGKPIGQDELNSRPNIAREQGVGPAVQHLKDLIEEAIDSMPACPGREALCIQMQEEARRFLPKSLREVA